MNFELKIKKLQELKLELERLSADEDFLARVEYSNPWFIPQFTKKALTSISLELLNRENLTRWTQNYLQHSMPVSVGIITAGNIPLVGFHDVLCVYMTGHSLQVKISSKDSFLTPHIIDIWRDIDGEWDQRLKIVDRIANCEKIIATGSNNSYKYFEYYFGKYSSLLRKNRTALGWIPKDITDRELEGLVDDIFLYFGLGCRNVSKLWIEQGFELKRIFETSEKYQYFFNHQKYMNNYDYQRTLLLLNGVEHLSNNFLMLREEKSIFSPISVLHYEWFENSEEVQNEIKNKSEDIQCVIGRNEIPYGMSQNPSLMDYADGVDVMSFLIQ